MVCSRPEELERDRTSSCHDLTMPCARLGCERSMRWQHRAARRAGAERRSPIMGRLIEDFALSSDSKSAAFAPRGGSVDWLCFPYSDSPACLTALVGSEENGHWSLAQRRRTIHGGPIGAGRSCSKRCTRRARSPRWSPTATPNPGPPIRVTDVKCCPSPPLRGDHEPS